MRKDEIVTLRASLRILYCHLELVKKDLEWVQLELDRLADKMGSKEGRKD